MYAARTLESHAYSKYICDATQARNHFDATHAESSSHNWELFCGMNSVTQAKNLFDVIYAAKRSHRKVGSKAMQDRTLARNRLLAMCADIAS